MPTIDTLANNAVLEVEERQSRIAELLSRMPDLGAAEALRVIQSTSSSLTANYAVNHLAVLPDHHERKKLAAQHLLAGDELADDATNLVRFLPDDLLKEIVDRYVRDPDRYDNLAFEVALHHPEHVRARSGEIEDEDMLAYARAGGPVEDLALLEKRYVKERDAELLADIARFHTAEAVTALMRLRAKVPPGELELWEAAIETAGMLPDGKTPSIFRPAFEGFVVRDGQTPHAMGGAFGSPVPICIACEKPSARVLSLSAAVSPHRLSHDAHFFWFECDCDAASTITVKTEGSGVEALLATPMGASAPGRLVPGLRSMQLEENPRHVGLGSTSVSGFGRHQVGGFTPWIRIERHSLCPGCRRPMRFLCAVDSGRTPFGRMGFDGTLYGFWCDGCGISETSRQSE